ncbi:dnaJ-like protein 60 isoform X2 [Teleopsis dalmanni]|uniref:dnaJ-like protein 60 isoform X2 n=1 Tax=Teleopsis dalmanni TaxID=139649 RepID=UPI0018CCBB40|nr:dnaJ-like protein 60 isoform X2 [Teleopsis dalmanni]
MLNLFVKPRLAGLINAVRKFSNRQTYYDVLELNKKCSNQDIKNAFVKLSKKFHPDVKGAESDPKQTAQFVKISEAYQTLSKPNLRRAYDQKISYQNSYGNRSYSYDTVTTEVHESWKIKPDFNPNPDPNAYYGVPGWKRISNSTIGLLLIGLGIFGAVFGYVSVKHSFTFDRKQLDEVSAEASQHHANVRADAQKFGNDEQLRRMMKKLQN